VLSARLVTDDEGNNDDDAVIVPMKKNKKKTRGGHIWLEKYQQLQQPSFDPTDSVWHLE